MKKILTLALLSTFACSFAVDIVESDFEFAKESFSQGSQMPDNGISCSSYSVVSSSCMDKFGVSEMPRSTTLGGHSGILPAQVHSGSSNNYVDSNSYKFDQNAVTNFNITNSNQTAMQSYATVINNNGNSMVSPSEMILNKLSVPIKTGDNSSIQVTPDKVEFNLKY